MLERPLSHYWTSPLRFQVILYGLSFYSYINYNTQNKVFHIKNVKAHTDKVFTFKLIFYIRTHVTT